MIRLFQHDLRSQRVVRSERGYYEKTPHTRLDTIFAPYAARGRCRCRFGVVADSDQRQCDSQIVERIRQILCDVDQRAQLRFLQSISGAVRLHVCSGANVRHLLLLDLAEQKRLKGERGGRKINTSGLPHDAP
jgi:hypothetical protein